MRAAVLASLSALLLAGSAMSAGAGLAGPAKPAPQVSNIVTVADGCGRGFHWSRRGCVPNHYRPYARGYRPYPYRGGYYGSPSDHVADQLNARELGRPPYRGY